MNKRVTTSIFLMLVGFLFLCVGALIAADVPDEVKIENKGYKKDQKGAVTLNHTKHNIDYNIACNECHHDYQDGKNIWKDTEPVKNCIECHNPLKKDGKIKKLQLAFHSNCKDCHKEFNKKEKKDAPYKKCTDCHAKK